MLAILWDQPACSAKALTLMAMEVAQPAQLGSAEFGEAKMRARERSSDFDADELFGRTRKGMPVWFKPERFLEPSFDAEAVVADLRRFVRCLCPMKR